jgi:hypothetical protein
LTLSQEKTRIRHTLRRHEDETPGFAFLGAKIGHRMVKGKAERRCKPSATKSVLKHLAEVKKIMTREPEETVEQKLEKKIRG